MLEAKLTVKECYSVRNNMSVFLMNADSVPAMLHLDLKEVQDAVEEHTERADEIQKELQKKYPFKWENEGDPDWAKDNPNKMPKKIFTGESADEKADDKTKAKRAELDEEDFNKEWEKVINKEKSIKVDVDFTRKDFEDVKSHPSVFECVVRALKPFGGIPKPGKKKKD